MVRRRSPTPTSTLIRLRGRCARPFPFLDLISGAPLVRTCTCSRFGRVVADSQFMAWPTSKVATSTRTPPELIRQNRCAAGCTVLPLHVSLYLSGCACCLTFLDVTFLSLTSQADGGGLAIYGTATLTDTGVYANQAALVCSPSDTLSASRELGGIRVRC